LHNVKSRIFTMFDVRFFGEKLMPVVVFLMLKLSEIRCLACET
jgi:hypothetical protein